MSAVIEALRERAASVPTRRALSDGSRELSYAELYAAVTEVAARLKRHGVRVLALAADNSSDWVVVDLAAQLAAIVLVPMPLFFSDEQVRHALADSGADAAILDATGEWQLQRVERVRLDAATPRLGLWRLVDTGVARRLPAATAKVSYTSGTTGRPKGVCLSQDLLDRVARSLATASASLAIEKHLCLLPLATLLENVAGVYAPLLAGAEIAVPTLRETGLQGGARLDVNRLLACLRSHEPQSVILLPQMLVGLVTAAECGERPPESLRFAAVGGGFVPRSLLERADRLKLPVYEGYGLTECGSVVALNSPGARQFGSVGRPLAHVTLRVGTTGEIFVAGATMAGYTGDADAPPTEIATGDLGSLDEDGFLHLNGRRKSVFITSFGRNVSPEWVEATLTAHPAIAQAALFGEARPWNVAVIVPARDDLPRAAIQAAVDAVNAGLPDYAHAHRWILAREPFTPLNGQLTTNGRNRRDGLWRAYRGYVDASYDECVDALA